MVVDNLNLEIHYWERCYEGYFKIICLSSGDTKRQHGSKGLPEKEGVVVVY